MDEYKRRQCVQHANLLISQDNNLEPANVPSSRRSKTFAFKHKDYPKVITLETKPLRKTADKDPNELMTAAATFITNLHERPMNFISDVEQCIKDMLYIIESGVVKDYHPNQLKLFNGDYDNCLQAVSAAKAIQEFIGGVPDVAYITGCNWSKDISKFKVTSYGMKNFNSSDIVFKKGDTFYGISLKKKDRSSKEEPTLINKSFNRLFPKQGKIRETLEECKHKFYKNVIREAIQDGKL